MTREEQIEKAADSLADAQTLGERTVHFGLIKTGIIMGAQWADSANKHYNEWKEVTDLLAKSEAKLAIAMEALEQAKFDLEMTRDTGGFNHRAVPLIDEALEKIRGMK